MADQPGFEDVAAELYALPTDEFIAARDAHSKAARAGGHKELAAEIAALRRPTVTAWIVNLLVRDQPELLDTLLALGADLREAQRDLRGPALRELAGQRNRLVAGLVRAARRVASDAGHANVTTDMAYDIEQTLHAALTDEDLAAELATGRLTKPLTPTGFGAGLTPDTGTDTGTGTGTGTEAPERRTLKAVPRPASTRPAARTAGKATADDREEREAARRQAERDRLTSVRDTAQADLDQAAAELSAARDAGEAAEQARADADALVEELGEQLAAARRAAREAAAAVRDAHTRTAAAARMHTNLTKSRDDAAARVERM
jgi:hypothetical protein